MTEARKLSRCAIYTRKSTEHNLDLEFNSLDAQREACEAYIKSQSHEGWRLIPGDFNDGAYSGASLERPALQALIAEIAAGKIDVVVVYKVDRLTRSLTDFAKLVELFDRHDVSFVSITQSFNTTTSMGRLTLNVLLSFAQFEREVIGERVRDKIAASKRKGLWMGGPVPLGYVAIDKKLIIAEAEAAIVRMIFRRYLELGSINALVIELDRDGARTKERARAGGRTVGGVAFTAGPLAYLLKNRIYVGEVVHQHKVFQGDHDAIIDHATFDAVQQKLGQGKVRRVLALKSNPAWLAGKIFDDQGNHMSPSHTLKKGVRYRYYVSRSVLRKLPGTRAAMPRVPAVEIEQLVKLALETDRQVVAGSAVFDRAIVMADAVKLHLSEVRGEGEEIFNRLLVVPWVRSTFGARKGVVRLPSGKLSRKSHDDVLTAISKARCWLGELVEGRSTIADIARREGKSGRHIRLLLVLAGIAPKAVEALIDGSAPTSLTVTGLAQALPSLWAKQACGSHQIRSA